MQIQKNEQDNDLLLVVPGKANCIHAFRIMFFPHYANNNIGKIQPYGACIWKTTSRQLLLLVCLFVRCILLLLRLRSIVLG